jgi:hypothetical protein
LFIGKLVHGLQPLSLTCNSTVLEHWNPVKGYFHLTRVVLVRYYKRMPRNSKLPQVNFVVSPELSRDIHQSAKLADKSVSEFCRDALREHVKRTSVAKGENPER